MPKQREALASQQTKIYNPTIEQTRAVLASLGALPSSSMQPLSISRPLSFISNEDGEANEKIILLIKNKDNIL